MFSQILRTGTVITMDPLLPRAEAVAVTDGRITAVGSLADGQEASPDAAVVDTGVAALLPGFVEPHTIRFRPRSGCRPARPPRHSLSALLLLNSPGLEFVTTAKELKDRT